jgi:hypothetical protein
MEIPVVLGQCGGGEFIGTPRVSRMVISAMVTGQRAGVVSLISIVRDGERSAARVVGALVTAS